MVTVTAVSDSPTSKRRRMRLELLQEMPNLSETSNTADGNDEQLLIKEIADYYSTSTKCCYSENALLFWRDYAVRLPVLSRLAAVYLGTSASSVPVESLFSITGLLLNSRRSSLSPSKVNKLVFLHDNFDLITTSNSAEAELGRVDQTLAADPSDPDPVAGPSWC